MGYLNDVFRYALARLGRREEAEDIAIEVVQALPHPCCRRELRVYMIGMARRKVANHLRRRRPSEAIRWDHAVESFDDAANESALVASAMNRLSPEHRDLLTLKYVLGFSSDEIGSALRKRASAVDSALQRARAAFETAWKEIE